MTCAAGFWPGFGAGLLTVVLIVGACAWGLIGALIASTNPRCDHEDERE